MGKFLMGVVFVAVAAFLIVTYVKGGTNTIYTETERIGNASILKLQDVEK